MNVKLKVLTVGALFFIGGQAVMAQKKKDSLGEKKIEEVVIVGFGQKKTVFVYRLVAPGTIEARVQELQQQKKELFDNLISDLPILEHIKEHFKSLNNLIDFKEEGE